MLDLKTSLETAPYCAALGIQVESITENSARLVLPYKDENSNPGKVLHGGVAASIINLGGLAVAQAALGDVAGPSHTCALQVDYLSAAIGETIVAEAQLLRSGKELCFVDIAVRTEGGKAIARGLSTVRGRFGGVEPAACPTRGDEGLSDPGPMGPHLPKRVPYIGARGMVVQNMSKGQARILMPYQSNNTDENGNVHEGPILALLDTTGAMAAWAETGPGSFKASTTGIQAAITAPSRAEDLIAYGRMLQRDREIFWCEVEVASAADRRVVARGMVIYRIVMPQ